MMTPLSAALRPLYIFAEDTCPYANQALEKYLLEAVQPGELILYLWQNRNTVVIGKNQNAWQECKVAELESDGGFLARRISGGGAVYHDLGNLNFTFLCRAEHYDVARNLQIIVRALESLGIRAEISGRNDVTVEGRKISGNAFYEGRACFHHGTLLIGVDTEQMSRYLQASAKKLASKGVTSVRARVANLREFSPGLSPEKVAEALIFALGEELGQSPERIFPAELDQARLRQLEAEFADADWRLGRPIPCQITLSERFSWGEVELRLQAERGALSQAQLFTDSLHSGLSELVETALPGLPLSSWEIARHLRQLDGPRQELEDLAALVEREGF